MLLLVLLVLVGEALLAVFSLVVHPVSTLAAPFVGLGIGGVAYVLTNAIGRRL